MKKRGDVTQMTHFTRWQMTGAAANTPLSALPSCQSLYFSFSFSFRGRIKTHCKTLIIPANSPIKVLRVALSPPSVTLAKKQAV